MSTEAAIYVVVAADDLSGHFLKRALEEDPGRQPNPTVSAAIGANGLDTVNLRDELPEANQTAPAVGIRLDRTVRRRWRAPTAAPGELMMRWGRMPHDAPDMFIAWGEGCSKRDGALLHWLLASPRQDYRYDAGVVSEPSFLEELEARGYDLTTLRFSVRKKAAPND